MEGEAALVRLAGIPAEMESVEAIHLGLASNLALDGSLSLLDDGLRLGSHDSSSESSALRHVVVELQAGVGDDLLQLRSILLAHLSQRNDGSSLLVNQVTQTSLALHNHVRNIHLTAESREPHDELDGVDIVSDDDQLGLLGLHQLSDVVETVLDEQGLLSLADVSLALHALLSLSLETLGLVLARLRAVVREEAEEGGRLVLIHGLGELVDGRGDFQALLQDGALTLDAHIARPLDEAGQVLGVLHSAADSVVAGSLREQVSVLLVESRSRALALGASLSGSGLSRSSSSSRLLSNDGLLSARHLGCFCW